MLLGIEIGGTKLQLGAGTGDGGPLADLVKLDVAPGAVAKGIRRQVESAAGPLIAKHGVRGIGIGFGGPVDQDRGVTITSHQIDGWDGFPLASWCRDTLGLPAVLGNDSDLAGLAEARFGAGKGCRVVLYSNVGSGIGGALVIGGQLYRGAGGVAMEIGHLRPGLHCQEPDETVESLASGWAISQKVQAELIDPELHALSARTFADRPTDPRRIRLRLVELEEAGEKAAADLLHRCDGYLERLTTKLLAEAAREGNELARKVFRHACQTYGWAIAQAITLMGAETVVIGGGVAQLGEELFLDPLRREVGRYVFPPLRESYRIVPALLGEAVVVHGALAIAADAT
ncbi:MAG: ROK family protein [Thermoguttaceae bacterium]|jgi:glucokinase|nr:ROK family protein [Thermoguttaceae bacterium]